MRWMGHVACMGRFAVLAVLGWGSLWESDHLDDPGVDGRIILQWIFKNGGGGAWTGLIRLRIGIDGGLL
jgi:hypothetical protein